MHTKKILNLLYFLCLGYILPLGGRLELLLHARVLVLLAAAAAVVLSQPPIGLAEAREQKDTDRFSLLWIILLALPAMAAPVVEWAYFGAATAVPNLLTLAPVASPDDLPAYQFVWPEILAQTWWEAAGMMLMATGLALRIWAIRTLGQAFSSTVQILQEHRLVTTGPYRIVRHPSYIGAYLVFLGGAVFLQAWVGLIVSAVCMGVAYGIRIPAEERALEANFGDEWRAYRKRTWGMVPGLW
ncbi:MAG: isoprenylcysteine carboxylmethyltransferase family protein [Saprospiraceae bacterium]